MDKEMLDKFEAWLETERNRQQVASIVDHAEKHHWMAYAYHDCLTELRRLRASQPQGE